MKFTIKTVSSILCIFILALIFFIGCDNTNKTLQKKHAKGFIWEATKGETTINLVGTMHPAPDTYELLNNNIINIIEESDTLWVELDLTNNENMKKMQNNYYLESNQKIGQYLSKENIENLSEILKNYNLQLSQVTTYNSVGLTTLINNFIMKEIKFTGAPLDTLMINLAKSKNVEIKEIEGVDYQINILNKIYTWEFLKESIENFNKDKQKSMDESNLIFQNYIDGNIELAEEYEDKIKNTFDIEMYKTLISDRNIEMVEKIKKYMHNGEKHTLAVGYRHFIGEDSIIKLLELEGYTITSTSLGNA